MPSRKVKILSSCHDGLFLRDMMMMPGTTVSTVSKASYSCTLHTNTQMKSVSYCDLYYIGTYTVKSNAIITFSSVRANVRTFSVDT